MHIPAEIFQGHFPAEEMGRSLVPKTLQKKLRWLLQQHTKLLSQKT